MQDADSSEPVSGAAVSPVDYSLVHPVPGHGKPLNYVPDEADPLYVGEPLPSALVKENMDEGAAVLQPTTLRELSMLQFQNAITDKDEWYIKIFDDAIANKWKAEAIEAAHEAYRKERDSEARVNERAAEEQRFAQWPVHTAPRDESLMTEAMATYCIEELRHKASLLKESSNGAIIIYNGDVVKSDHAVSQEIKHALQQAVKSLEDVPENQKDWHPGSDEKVLDLVHPSLFPLIYGRSRILDIGEKAVSLNDCGRRIGEGKVIAIPDAVAKQEVGSGWGDVVEMNPYSTQFQWLPCEVDLRGDKPKIISYINNLHPGDHLDLYGVIEDVIAAAIPLWEMTLAPGTLGSGDYTPFQRIQYDWPDYDPNPDRLEREAGPDDWGLRWEWKSHVRRTIQPEPGQFDPDAYGYGPPEPCAIKTRLADLGRPLQVIVKLANIHLTPDKPKYEGGTWHVEGKLNERIVATALYYYSSKNITRSSLAFRQLSSVEAMDEMSYEQGVHDFLSDVFGCKNDEGAVQEVGSVETREGRLLTFPNILQHQVQPFELEDKSKPGHRKILALFLVDPNVRVPSTAYVPPQQLSWWRRSLHQDNERMPIQDLPLELQDQVYDRVEDFPISLVEAKRIREGLIDERKQFVLEHSKAFEASMTFSLCEH